MITYLPRKMCIEKQLSKNRNKGLEVLYSKTEKKKEERAKVPIFLKCRKVNISKDI